MKRIKKPSPAVLVAVIAMVAAISGMAAAAPIGPTKATTASSKGTRGPRGYRGFRGPKGAAGGIATVAQVTSPMLTLAPGQTTFDVDPSGTWQANCPAGETAIGTGFNASVGQVAFVEAFGRFVGGFIINPTSVTIQVTVQAICGETSGSGGLVRGSSRVASEGRYDSMLATSEAAFKTKS